MNPMPEITLLMACIAFAIYAAYSTIRDQQRFQADKDFRHQTPAAYTVRSYMVFVGGEGFVLGIASALFAGLGSPPPSGLGWGLARSALVGRMVIAGFGIGSILLLVTGIMPIFDRFIGEESRYRKQLKMRRKRR
jgi:hypothetical protein